MRHVTDLEADNLTSRGAHALVKRIEKFWHDQGHHSVTAWVHEFRYSDVPTTQYAVRSNLINGLPPKKFRNAKPDATGALRIGRPRKLRFAEVTGPGVNI